MIKLKIFKAEFTESKVAFKKVAFLGKWLKPLFSTCKRIALNNQPEINLKNMIYCLFYFIS